MPVWLIATLTGVAAFGCGVAVARAFPRRRPAPLDVPEAAISEPEEAPVVSAPAEEPVEGPERSLHLVSLLGNALRDVLRALRRGEASNVLVPRVERIVWQSRMLVSTPRPMQAQPTSPISLLQSAAEEVEALRLGKVSASWSVRTRRPVHVDVERARGAFRELLYAAVDAVGEGGRVAIRVREGEDQGYPVEVEVEIGRRGAELGSLAFLVARKVLEGQGARIELDGAVTRVALRCLGPEPLDFLDEPA